MVETVLIQCNRNIKMNKSKHYTYEIKTLLNLQFYRIFIRITYKNNTELFPRPIGQYHTSNMHSEDGHAEIHISCDIGFSYHAYFSCLIIK